MGSSMLLNALKRAKEQKQNGMVRVESKSDEKARLVQLINKQTETIRNLKTANVELETKLQGDIAELRGSLRFAERTLTQLGLDVAALLKNPQKWDELLPLIEVRINTPEIGVNGYANQYQIDQDMEFLKSVFREKK